VCAGHSQQRCDDLYWAAQDSKEFFSLYFLKKIKIFPSALCVLAGQKKKAKQHASWSD
jgi:hypothetical protein